MLQWIISYKTNFIFLFFAKLEIEPNILYEDTLIHLFLQNITFKEQVITIKIYKLEKRNVKSSLLSFSERLRTVFLTYSPPTVSNGYLERDETNLVSVCLLLPVLASSNLTLVKLHFPIVLLIRTIVLSLNVVLIS